ncbi:hypothetical protein KCU83_g2694, partial [Aureobasidium melanogenum]
MPPKGSKRTEVVTLIDEPNKKPRLDLEEQIKRAAVLAAQLHNGVKDDAESKSSAATQIATEELMRIFESMQEKTNDTSKAVEDLITTQINLEVKLKMDALQNRMGRTHIGPKPLTNEIAAYLNPGIPESRELITKMALEKMAGVTSGDLTAQATEAVESAIVEEFQKGINKQLREFMSRSATHISLPQTILTVNNKMSKSAQDDIPMESNSTQISKQPRLDLQEQLQRAVALATQMRHAAGKEHLSSTEWTANQTTANELLRTFENVQEKTNDAAESIGGLIATQIKLEVKLKMSALNSRVESKWTYPLANEIKEYLAPAQIDSRERIITIALEKLQGFASSDLKTRVTEEVEAAILEEFHKGVDGRLRDYMQ